ncbi:unnamed protein product, partial [Rotaria sp. Silwood2]
TKAEYLVKVKNFANDLSERLKTNYFLLAEQPFYKHQANNNNTPLLNDHDDNSNPVGIRQRCQPLKALLESLKPTIKNNNQ